MSIMDINAHNIASLKCRFCLFPPLIRQVLTTFHLTLKIILQEQVKKLVSRVSLTYFNLWYLYVLVGVGFYIRGY